MNAYLRPALAVVGLALFGALALQRRSVAPQATRE